MRHRHAPYLLALALSFLSAPAEARTITVRLAHAPRMTLTVPPGWHAREDRTVVWFTRPGHRTQAVTTCMLVRSDHDMSGRSAVRRAGGEFRPIPVRGGGCIGGLSGNRPFLRRLKPVLGSGGAAPASDAAAEQLARAAQARTLAQPRVTGTAVASLFGNAHLVTSVFESDVPGDYEHQLHSFGGSRAEVIRMGDEDRARFDDEACWGFTGTAEDDDALEPLLELKEWDAPPSTKTSWHVAYAPVEHVGDVSIVRWTGFVADGEAEIGSDGLLRRVVIRDHHMARGRTVWRTVDIAFTGFPAAIAPVRPEPSC